MRGTVATREILSSPDELAARGAEWNQLALLGGSPFLTAEWLAAWWKVFGRGAFCLLLRNGEGSLRGGACLRRLPAGRMVAAANVHSGDWDVVAADEETRGALWREIATLGPGLLKLSGIRDDPHSLDPVSRALAGGGYGVVEIERTSSPYLQLPPTFDRLLASASRNLRSQIGRRRRALEREGRVGFRTTNGDTDLERDLDAFLAVEASGWKGRSGTAITSDEGTERLYRDFARRAASAGWLRLHLLELDGIVIAADLNCRFADGTFLIKTGFNEAFSRLSPGLVLRAEVLRTAIEEGSSFYDFLGGPDPYKLRWTAMTRPRVTLAAYRGPWRPLFVYRSGLRPRLKSGRDLLRKRTQLPRRRVVHG